MSGGGGNQGMFSDPMTLALIAGTAIAAPYAAPLLFEGGALAGSTMLGAGVTGAGIGGAAGKKEAIEAEKQAQAEKRRSDILARQTKTAMQQEAKAASGAKASSVKAPPMAPVSGMDAAMQAMPATTGKGTAYDAWRSTVYGG